MAPYQAYRDEERDRKRRRTEPQPPGSPESIGTPEANTTSQPTQMTFFDAAIQVLSKFAPPTPKSNLKYLSLDEDTEIRLLHLTPGEPEDPIVCRLSPMSLDKPQEYRALSYCWGTGPAKHEVRIIQTQHTPGQKRSLKDIHHGTLYVKPNLYAALHHLRDLEETRVFWVDAICINQDDVREQNEQVAKMAEIYSMADHVDIVRNSLLLVLPRLTRISSGLVTEMTRAIEQ
jgi:Heterokaryon incompatibility protein (HET)